MFFFATLWAALLNLVLLATALAQTPAFWTEPAHWLKALPWRSFGTEAAGLLHMRPVDAPALWALWLCVSAVLLLGALAAYALLKLRAPLPVAAPLPTPEVSAMFDQLSGSLRGLQGFGGLDAPAAASSPPQSVPVLTVLAKAPSGAAPASIASSLQQIDPELRSSYDALLRELGAAKPSR
jgi:hypothetical protein